MNPAWMITPEPFVYREDKAYSAEVAGTPPTSNRNSSAYIRWAQESLNKIMGLRLAVDGVMGPMTRAAVRDFQRRQGLTADGVVGPQTERALIRSVSSLPSTNIITMPPITIVGQPCERLDGFEFNKADLTPDHRQRIAQLAQRIVASQSTPQAIHTVRVIGHTDPVGNADYNVGLGQRRALRVRSELMKALDGVRRGSSSRVLILASSRGEREPISSDDAQNRRVEVCLSTKALQPPRPPARPPSQPPQPPQPPSQPPQDTPPSAPPSVPSCNRAEFKRMIDACVEDTKRCVIQAHQDLALDLSLNPVSNARAMAKYFLALRRCREALLRCDAEARRATNCP